MRIFCGKTVKIVSASGDPSLNSVSLRRLEDPPPYPRVVTPVYYYNFIELVSSGKYILFHSRKNQVTTANDQPLLLQHFCTYVLIQTVSFVEGGRKNISCPRAKGTLATPLTI